MKTENRTFFQALGKTQMENLVKEVKETKASEEAKPAKEKKPKTKK